MKTCAICLFCFLLFLAPPALGNDWGPWEIQEKIINSRDESPTGFGPLKMSVRFFQKFISPVDGARCPMYPTCSTYALQALKKHGPFIGTMMTVDRLFHETDPREHKHPVRIGERTRFFDPVENNDFWWAPRN